MRDKNMKTYGRHKYRVVHTDAWLSDSDKKVFTTSSENDSSLKRSNIFQSSSSGSEMGHLSFNSTGNSIPDSQDKKRTTRNTKKGKKGTENKENNGIRKRRHNHRTEKSIFSNSTSDSSTPQSNQKSRALRDRNKKVDYNDEVNSRKTYREKRCKRKRADQAETPRKPLSINFNDFDDYSLLVSDSPPINEPIKVSAPSCVETSTPVAKRTRRHSNVGDKLKDANISVIDIAQSPMSPTCGGTVPTPESGDRGGYSYMTDGSPYLESTSLSQKQSDVSEQSSMESSANLQKHRDSYMASLKSNTSLNWSSRLRSRGAASNSNDFTASLFDSPTEGEKSIQILSDQLRKIVLRKQQLELDCLEEKGSEESEEDELDEEEEEEDEEESGEEEVDTETEQDSEYCEEEESDDECLSDIVEDESNEEEEEIEESDISDIPDENNSDDDCSSSHSNHKKSLEDCEAVVNLQKLSESFVNNFVSQRSTRNSRRKATIGNSVSSDCVVDNKSMTDSHRGSSDSNCTLYCLNEEYSGDKNWGSIDLFDSGSNSGADSSGQSRYKTAMSSRTSDDEFHSAMGSQAEDSCEPQVHPTPKTPCYATPKSCSLRNRELEQLRDSFTEMLTPIRLKSKKRLIPVSFESKVCILCDQTHAISFKEALPQKMLTQCKKIGEGVYGEVFRSSRDGHSVAIKIIPIEGDFPVNDEPQKTYEEIIPEIVIAKELSNLRLGTSSQTSNFCEVNNISLVKGQYPPELLKQWDVFHKNRGSENDRPDVFKDQQLYIVFEFADCGRDLESYKFDSLHQAKSVITQVAFGLAVAEEALQFEHRDLHWGNVLIKETSQEDIVFKVCGKRNSVPSMGVEANIIDFTLSRLTKDGCTVHTDLSKDNSLFEGKGDYQFDIYRNMKKENNNNWEEFHPRTNVFWIHYLADKLVYATKYPTKSGRQDRELTRQFRQFMSEILNYSSACEMVLEADFLNS